MRCRTSIKISFAFNVLLMIACTPAGKISVTNVNDTGSLKTGSFIYALPQTVIDIHVTTKEIVVEPGPYEKYAKKYLGIDNAPSKSEHYWYIQEVRMKTHSEADPDYVYEVSKINNTNDSPGLTRLIKDSLILDTKNFSFNEVYYSFHPSEINDVLYTDLSVKRNFESEKDIEVSLVLPDTNYNEDQLRKNALIEKTLEQKAEEAANFLIKLKKRRFKLVAGQYDYMPEGEAMAEALKELAQIEDEYLSLFIGKRTVKVYERDFHYTPVTGKENDRVVLFRFSEEKGFINTGETTGVPVVIEFKALNKIKGLSQYRLPTKSSENVLPYRIADQVSLKLTVGEQLWAEAMCPVYQAGVIITMSMYGSR